MAVDPREAAEQAADILRAVTEARGTGRRLVLLLAMRLPWEPGSPLRRTALYLDADISPEDLLGVVSGALAIPGVEGVGLASRLPRREEPGGPDRP